MPIFLIWRGWGILAILIPVVICFVCAVIGEAISALLGGGNPASRFPVALGLAVGGAVSAYLVWTLGAKWNSDPGRVLIDPATGSRVMLRRTHSLFWIPMQWWGPVFGIIAVVLAIAMLFPSQS